MEVVTIQVAILHENDRPIRAWKGSACIYKAYTWAHHHFCLADEGYKVHTLPDWLKVTYHIMTEQQFSYIKKYI